MKLTYENIFLGAVVTKNNKNLIVYKINQKTFYAGEMNYEVFFNRYDKSIKGTTFKDFAAASKAGPFSYEDFNIVGKDGSVTRYEETITSPEYEIDNKELFKNAKEELSYEGFIVFKYIVGREWEIGRRRAFPTNSALAKHFGYSEDIMNSIMSEIRRFWLSVGWQVA